MTTRPEWLYGTPTPRNNRARLAILCAVALVAAVALVLLTACERTPRTKPAPQARTAATAAQSAPVKAPNVPETIGTSYSVTSYPAGTVIPLDVAKLPGVDCWYEVSAMDDDHVPGGSKHIEVRAICP